jgi:DNA modification methylase
MTLRSHYEAAGVTLFHGDCLDVLRELPDESVHAVVTDPPYGLSNTDPDHITEAITHWTTGDRAFLPSAGGGFMGKAWDEFVPPPAVWDECMRVLKPGGHLLAFAGSRTVDLMALSIRLAGFDIRDSIAWLYGSGFPKSLDVAAAIDKRRTEDVDRVEAVRIWLNERRQAAGLSLSDVNIALGMASNGGGQASTWMTNKTTRAVPTDEQWEQLRQLLSFDDAMDAEVRALNARKGTAGDNFTSREVVGSAKRGAAGFSADMVPRPWKEQIGSDYDLTAPNSEDARTWQGWGTALKPAFEPIVVARKPLVGTVAANVLAHGTGALNIDASRVEGFVEGPGTTPRSSVEGRRTSMAGAMDRTDYDGSKGRWPANVVLDESQAAALDQQTGVLTSGSGAVKRASGADAEGNRGAALGKESRPAGTPMVSYGDSGGASRMFPTFRYEAKAPTSERPVVDGVAHPTVKPLDLMRWLVRLVTPKGGTVLEPFAGSGTTVEACLREGFDVIAIEREADYLPLIKKRIQKDHAQGLDFDWGDAS